MPRVAPSQQYQAPSHADSVKLCSRLIAIIGAYMLISAWIRDIDIGNQLNAIIAGAVALTLGVTINENTPGPWASWVVAVIGVWFVLSPWIYRYAGTDWTWHSVLAGIALVLLGVWSASLASSGRRHRRSRRR